MLHLFFNFGRARLVYTVDVPYEKLPMRIVNLATLIIEGKPEGLKKDRYGMFIQDPSHTLREMVRDVELWFEDQKPN